MEFRYNIALSLILLFILNLKLKKMRKSLNRTTQRVCITLLDLSLQKFTKNFRIINFDTNGTLRRQKSRGWMIIFR